jgi:citrate lyase beta subunit
MSKSKGFTVSLEVIEEGHTTNATARLAIGGEELAATGMAQRNPDDPDRPMIGDELAIARALLVLARELGQKVDEGVAAYEGHQVHVSI